MRSIEFLATTPQTIAQLLLLRGIHEDNLERQSMSVCFHLLGMTKITRVKLTGR